jgi:hypothetical protein
MLPITIYLKALVDLQWMMIEYRRSKQSDRVLPWLSYLARVSSQLSTPSGPTQEIAGTSSNVATESQRLLRPLENEMPNSTY